jgi:hypothetical protein
VMDANRATWNRRTNILQTVLYSSMQQVHAHNTVQIVRHQNYRIMQRVLEYYMHMMML